jgi:flavorubredoxin
MRAAIIYYSYSGNTKMACLFLARKLRTKSVETDLIELKPKNEARSFFKQGGQAFFKDTIELAEVNYNVNGYDLIIFASPVWAFTFAPSLRAYLEKVINLEEKRTACFLTFGSGLGKGKALVELKNILKDKKSRFIFATDFAGAKTKDNAYLEEAFKSLFTILNI